MKERSASVYIKRKKGRAALYTADYHTCQFYIYLSTAAGSDILYLNYTTIYGFTHTYAIMHLTKYDKIANVARRQKNRIIENGREERMHVYACMFENKQMKEMRVTKDLYLYCILEGQTGLVQLSALYFIQNSNKNSIFHRT